MPARFETSPIGRVLISLLVAAVVLTVAVVDMPASQTRDDLLGPAGWVARATGLDQDWGVFAPPRTVALVVEARIDDADGTTTVETTGDAGYRWGKFAERVRLDEQEPLWAPYARFVADRARAHGRTPVRVSLVRRWAETLPPGPGPQHGPWQEFMFFVLPVGPT